MTTDDRNVSGVPDGTPAGPEQSLQDENTQLRAEVARLEAESSRHGRGTGLRDVLTWVLIVLASLALVFSVIAVWLHQELFDSSQVIATVEPILQNPAVATNLSARVSEELILALDIKGRAQEALPDRARFLASAIASAAQEFVRRQLESLFSDPRFQDAVLRAIGVAHELIVRILRGQSDVVQITNGVVTLNLFPLVEAALRQIEASGLVPSGITLPRLSGTEAPSVARQQLSQAIGTRLPDNFGEITLFESQELEQAKQAVQIFDTLVIVLPIVTLILAAGALVLSPHRRRTVLQLGLGAVIALVFARLTMRLIERSVASAAQEDPSSGAVVTAAVDTLVNSLLGFTNIFVIIGTLVALVAFLLGRPEWFAAARQRIRALAGRGPSTTTANNWVNRHTDVLRIAGVGVAVVALFLLPLSWGLFLIVLLLLIAYQAALSFVQSRAGPPDDVSPPGSESVPTA